MASECSSDCSSSESSRVRLQQARRMHEHLQQQRQRRQHLSVQRTNNKTITTTTTHLPVVLPTSRAKLEWHDKGIANDTSDEESTPTVQRDGGVDDAAIEKLATELRSLWHHDHQQPSRNKQDDPHGEQSAILALLEKIGDDEKNGVVLHLLKQLDEVQCRRDATAALGEQIAAQLIQQQHELRTSSTAQIRELQQEVEHVRRNHPDVERLEAQVVAMATARRDSERKLQFAATKLQRSRQRERALQRLHDPLLWDI